MTLFWMEKHFQKRFHRMSIDLLIRNHSEPAKTIQKSFKKKNIKKTFSFSPFHSSPKSQRLWKKKSHARHLNNPSLFFLLPLPLLFVNTPTTTQPTMPRQKKQNLGRSLMKKERRPQNSEYKNQYTTDIVEERPSLVSLLEDSSMDDFLAQV